MVIVALVDSFCSEVRLASARLPQKSQILSFFLEISMSTNRCKDRSSLCSFMFVDCRHRPVSSRAQRRIRFRRRSGGLQTGQRDGRERPWCPVSPAFRGGVLFPNPQLSQGPPFFRRSPPSPPAH